MSRAVILVILGSAIAQGARVRRDEAYGAPEAPAYSAPSYSAPEESYGAPAESYSAPSYSAPAETGLDLTTLLIPLLALVGLFLLFPTYVTLTSVDRRKRDADNEFPEEEQFGMLNKLQDMVQAVVESEECMERIACDVGDLAKGAGFDSSLVSAAILVAPKQYTRYIKQFASPKNCHKIKCGNMF